MQAFIQVDDTLAWSHAIGGEDDSNLGWENVPQNPPIEKIHFRTERQSLRRLPRTGAIVFTIRTYMLPLTSLAQEPYAPGKFAEFVRSWKGNIGEYKGSHKFKDVVCEYLDGEHQKQLDSGLKVEEEPNLYPF